MSTDLDRLETVAPILEALGVSFTASPSHPHKITQIQLPFSEKQWLHLCVREGAFYVGGCCAQLSLVQDEMNRALREAGWVNSLWLIRVCEALKSHGDEGYDEPYKAVSKKTFKGWTDPYFKLAYLWSILKHALSHDVPTSPQRGDYEPIEWAVKNVAQGVRNLDTHLLYERVLSSGRPMTPPAKAELTLSLAALLPHLKTLTERIKELAPDPFTGFGILNKEGVVVLSAAGPCLYDTEKEAQEWFDDYADLYPEEWEGHRVARVQVSFEGGITELAAPVSV